MKDTKDFCSKDYKNRHYWSSIGVLRNDKIIVQVWKCSQCSKALLTELEFVNIKREKE